MKSLNGNPSAMMIRFNSAKHTVTPGTGFSVTVEAYNSGEHGFLFDSETKKSINLPEYLYQGFLKLFQQR